MADIEAGPDVLSQYGVSSEFPNATRIPSGRSAAEGGGSYGFDPSRDPVVFVDDPDVPGGGQVMMRTPDGKVQAVELEGEKIHSVTPPAGRPRKLRTSQAEKSAKEVLTPLAPPPAPASNPAVVGTLPDSVTVSGPSNTFVVVQGPPPPSLKVAFEGSFGTVRTRFHDYVPLPGALALIYKCTSGEEELEYEPPVSIENSLRVSIPSERFSAYVRHLGVVLPLKNYGIIVLVLFHTPPAEEQ